MLKAWGLMDGNYGRKKEEEVKRFKYVTWLECLHGSTLIGTENTQQFTLRLHLFCGFGAVHENDIHYLHLRRTQSTSEAALPLKTLVSRGCHLQITALMQTPSRPSSKLQ